MATDDRGGAVIVAVDRLGDAADAVALGRMLCGLTGAPLRLACVYPFVVGPNRDPDVQAGLRSEADEALERAAGRLRATGDVELEPLCDTSVGRALSELAERERGSYMVIGPSHHAGLGRLLPGGTGERLLHGAPCPVALAPRGFASRASERTETIGCAYDGRPESASALAVARRLARAAGCGLEVVRAIDPVLTRPLGTTIDVGIMEAMRIDLAERLGGDGTAVVLEGDPVSVLVERSRRLDLLVCGSRGYGPLHAVMVGGVSGRLTRGAQCPVVVIPRGAAAAADPADASVAAPAAG